VLHQQLADARAQLPARVGGARHEQAAHAAGLVDRREQEHAAVCISRGLARAAGAYAAGERDAVLTRTVTGKSCRTLRNAFSAAYDAPGAPEPLPAPLQNMLWWAHGRTRVERARAEPFLTYPVGQLVGDMNADSSVRQVVQDMLLELAETKERLDGMLG